MDSRSSAENEPGQSRRSFLRGAVATGGAAALAACVDVELDGDPTETETLPRGPSDPSVHPDRQHEWGAYLVRDRFGNTQLPQHQSFVMLDYVGGGLPTDAERRSVERAFRTLERAYQRGTGGDARAVSHEGLLFTVGYSPGYFERFDAQPAGVDLRYPADVIDELGEDATADDYDAMVHMASAYGSVLLSAEEALFGEADTLNGVDVEGTLADVFEVTERRTGFIGRGQPARKYDHEDIPDNAPLSMGFKSGFKDNLAKEDAVTVREGPFAGGTTQQVSKLTNDLEAWYDRPKDERVKLMFSPHHSPSDVGDVGENLADDSGLTEEHVDRLEEDTGEHGCVGHAQKIAQSRDDDFESTILRRDVDITGEPGIHFDGWQRGTETFLEMRKAMNSPDLDVDDAHHGILDFIEVRNRATYLMPPRNRRALPEP